MDDLPLNIPLAVLSDYIHCAICMLELTETVLTPCGHRFCDKCISEWIDRQEKCPCCNASLALSQLTKDHQYDALVGVITKEKERASSKYFENLIANVSKEESSQAESDSSISIETVLQRHILPSLAAHKNYCEKIKKEYQVRKNRLGEKHRKEVAELERDQTTQAETESERLYLDRALHQQETALSNELATCMDLVAQAYDRHLTKCIPPVDLLPVEVTVYILEKDVRITNVQMKPRDCGSVIWDIVKKTMKERDDPVVSWGEDVRMMVFGPFAKSSQDDMRRIARDVSENGNTKHPDVSVVKERTRLVLELGMKPGSEVVLYGSLVCESDQPKQCFSRQYDTNKPSHVDYFTCKDCSCNWICRSCMSVCHEGHETVPYILNHQPTWACCYCPKKKKCLLSKAGQ